MRLGRLIQSLGAKETKEKINTSTTKSLIVENLLSLKAKTSNLKGESNLTALFALELDASPSLRRKEEDRRPEIKRFDCLIYRGTFSDFLSVRS